MIEYNSNSMREEQIGTAEAIGTIRNMPPTTLSQQNTEPRNDLGGLSVLGFTEEDIALDSAVSRIWILA